MILKHIINGWGNVIIKDKEVEELAENRLKSCSDCPKKIQMFNVDCCGLCHCPLLAKIRSIETTCPLGKW